jgi:serine/threonine protein kinase
MENVFGKYRTITHIATESANPAYRARLNTGTKWQFMAKAYSTHKVQAAQEQEELQKEMQAFLQLDHPHILPIIDCGIEQGIPYWVTAYMERGSLRNHLDQTLSSQLSGWGAVKIILQVGQALQYAHEHHILHGNIKPENILFDNDNKIVLTDFCLPHFAGEIEEGRIEIQSAYYPEQESLSEKSDQYALACLAHELFTGLRLAAYSFTASASRLSLAETPIVVSPLERLDKLERLERVEKVLQKAMAKEPDERYENVAALLKAISGATAPSRLFLPVPGIALLKNLSTGGLAYLEKIGGKHPALRLISRVRRIGHKQRLRIIVPSLFVVGALGICLFLSLFSVLPSVQSITQPSRQLESTVAAITPSVTVAAVQNNISASASALLTSAVSPTASISNSQGNSAQDDSSAHSSSKSSHHSDSSSRHHSSHQAGSFSGNQSPKGDQPSQGGRFSGQHGSHGFP